MITVPASEFQKNFGAYKEIAQREPVVVTSNGRESVVVISAEVYAGWAALNAEKAPNPYADLVSDDFRKNVASRIKKHRGVLEGLAK